MSDIEYEPFDDSDTVPDYVEFDNKSYDDDVPTPERTETGHSSPLLVSNDEENSSFDEASEAEDNNPVLDGYGEYGSIFEIQLEQMQLLSENLHISNHMCQSIIFQAELGLENIKVRRKCRRLKQHNIDLFTEHMRHKDWNFLLKQATSVNMSIFKKTYGQVTYGNRLRDCLLPCEDWCKLQQKRLLSAHTTVASMPLQPTSY
ncbi:hypothetical protein HHI36_004367 [Cryptolaemus montrouzieri]|uniref:Uncharacterized protein n=1 Tax=Cryptolaemus montrouzieri TaxID=559131 RepID=A0ABD2NQZ5_9CUCU